MKRALFICLVALLAISVNAQSPPTPTADLIADHVVAELKTAGVPGAGIAIVSGEEVVARGYGIANTETGTVFQPHTAVHLGSLTKLFTALAVTSALDALKLPPETTVGPYVQGLAPPATTATFHHLLSQTSGLRDRAGDYGSDVESALGDSARELTGDDFLLPPGTVFSYTNLGYALAGAALEGLRKRPYAEAMRTEIFAPLGMTRSTLRLRVATAGDHAVGHRREKDTLSVVKPIANDTRIWPAGYMWSTASDMSRALYALMHNGRVNGKQALPAAVIERVMTPHTPLPNVFVGGHYGYGLMIARDRGLLMYEHGGTLPGFSSILRFVPERGVGIAILSNLDNAPLRRIAQTVVSKALALSDEPPPARKETVVTPAEMEMFFGNYRNRGIAQLREQNGRVVLIVDDGPPMTVSRLDANRYLARPTPAATGPEFVLQPAQGSTPAYLHFALWAYAKDRRSLNDSHLIAVLRQTECSYGRMTTVTGLDTRPIPAGFTARTRPTYSPGGASR
jgi:CubicO group peptidase (beta-lactamase class C family)